MAGKNMVGDVSLPVEVNRAMIETSLKFFDAPAINLQDPEQIRQRIFDYFTACADRGLRPSNLGLYSSLGLSRQDVSDILRGENRSKVNRDAVDMIKRAKLVLSSYREGLAISGKLNPVTAIFWAKNFDGMRDSQDIAISRADSPVWNTGTMTQEEIAKRIPVYNEDGDSDGMEA